MQQKQNKGAVIKGFAFPIGYFLFMMIFQNVLLFAYVFFCMLRDIFIPIASAATDPAHFAELLSKIANSPELERYINESLLPELTGTPTYFLSVLTSIIAVVVLWLVFNRKNRDFKEYFGFKPTSFRAIAAAVLLGLGFYFLVNAVLTVVNILSNMLILELLIPAMRSLTDQLLQSGQYDAADLLRELADTLEGILNTPAVVPPLGWFTVAAIIFAPLVEEMIFRAGAISNLRKKLPVAVAILLSSLLFSLAHIGSLNLGQLVYTFILGAVAALLYVWSDSIYPSIICHFCFNGANIVTLAIYKLFSLDLVQTNEHGNIFLGINHFVYPNPDVLLAWGNTLTLLFLFVTAILSIPMLIVGVFLLLSLRPKKKAAQPYTVPAQAAPAVQAVISGEPQVIAAESASDGQTDEQPLAKQAPAEELIATETDEENTIEQENAKEGSPAEQAAIQASTAEQPAPEQETDSEEDA